MDNLTHSLVGALIGQAGLKRKTGLAMPALIIGANLPDVDAACFLWLDGLEHLAFRRGITHGPIAWVLLPLVLSGLLWWWDRWQDRRGTRPEGRLPVRFGWLYGLAFLATLTHPALDWLNVYGIRLLEPFSSRWFYGDVLFIIDVWLWALLGFATWFSLRREKRGGEWKRPARIALAVGLGYVGVNAGVTGFAETRATALVRYTYGFEPTLVVASPPPLAWWQRNILWRHDEQQIPGLGALYGDGDFTITGAISLNEFRLHTRPPPLTFETPVRELAWEYAQSFLVAEKRIDCWKAESSDVRAFLFWARMPVVFAGNSVEQTSVWDQRFADERVRGRFTVTVPEAQCGAIR